MVGVRTAAALLTTYEWECIMKESNTVRKAVVKGFVRGDWDFRLGDFGMIYLPSLNEKKRLKDERLVRVTIEEVETSSRVKHFPYTKNGYYLKNARGEKKT